MSKKRLLIAISVVAIPFLLLWPGVILRTLLAAIVIVVVLALLCGIWLSWWRLPKWQAGKLDLTDQKARADVEDNFRKTVGQALGGAAVLVGAVVAYLQFTQQQEASRDQLKASHDLLISTQVSRGFEQLAGNKLAMRLGGIYALEGVMNTSPEYRRPVLEALCAFVRDSTRGEVNAEPATDVQAALTVIGRRKLEPAEENNPIPRIIARAVPAGTDATVNLAGAKIPGANLRNVSLFDANLRGANLNLALLEKAVLSFADLRSAELREAELTDTDLTDADLTGADLTGALNLSQERLDRACGKPKALPRGLMLNKLCPIP